MRTNNTLLVMLGILSLAILITGCMPEEQAVIVNDTETPMDAEISNDNTDTTPEDTQTNQTQPATVEQTDTERKTFADIMKMQRPSEFTIYYDVSVESQEQTADFEQKMVMKGEDRFKTEVTGMQDGQEYISQVYQMDDKYYMCFNYEGSWSCLEAQSMNQTDYESQQDTAEKYQSQVKYKQTRTIASMTADCYEMQAEEEGIQYYEWCYDTSSGLLLYAGWKSADATGSMTATSVSKTAAESEFDLPAEPTDMSQYGYQ